MRRITVYQREGAWHYATADDAHGDEHPSALSAAIAARDYADTLRGEELGYVIRLRTSHFGDDLLVTLHTHVFEKPIQPAG